MFVYFHYNHSFGLRNACIISEGIMFLYDIMIRPSGIFYCVFPFMCVFVCCVLADKELDGSQE